MEHLIKKIADISKEKDCHVWLGIMPEATTIELSAQIGLKKVY